MQQLFDENFDFITRVIGIPKQKYNTLMINYDIRSEAYQKDLKFKFQIFLKVGVQDCKSFRYQDGLTDDFWILAKNMGLKDSDTEIMDELIKVAKAEFRTVYRLAKGYKKSDYKINKGEGESGQDGCKNGHVG